MKRVLTCSLVLAGLTLWWGQVGKSQGFSEEDWEQLELVSLCDELDREDPEENRLLLAICTDLNAATADTLSELAENAVLFSLLAEVLATIEQDNLVQAYLDFRFVYPEYLLSLNETAVELLELEDHTPYVEEKIDRLEAYREAFLARDLERPEVFLDGIDALVELLEEVRISRQSVLGNGKEDLERRRQIFGDRIGDGPSGTSMAKQDSTSMAKQRIRQTIEWIEREDSLGARVQWSLGWIGSTSPADVERTREHGTQMARAMNPSTIERQSVEFTDTLLSWTCDWFGIGCPDSGDEQCPPDEEGCQEDDGEALARLISISCGVFGVCPEELSALSVDDNGGVGACDPRTGADCGGDVRFLHDTDEPILDAAGGPCDGRGNDENCEPREDNAVDYSALIRSLAACPPDADNCGDFGFDIPVGGPIGPSTAMPVIDTVETVDVEVAVEEVEEIPEDLPENS